MDNMIDQGVALFSECCNLLRSGNNEGIQYATGQIDGLLSNPHSIQILLKYYESNTDQIQRQFGLIYLNRAIENSWNNIENEMKPLLFNQILGLLINETIWVNRRNLIDCIHGAMSEELDDVLLNFIRQAYSTGSEGYLEIALLLSPLIPTRSEHIEKYVPLAPFFNEMVEKGLNSNQPEIRLSGFYFLCYSKLFTNAHVFEQSPVYWEKCIELFDSYIVNQQELHRLVNLFNYAIQEHIFCGDPLTLLFKLMSYFACDPSPSADILMQIHTIISNICSIYAAPLTESEAFIPLIQLHISMSYRLYLPEDSFTLSNAQFFESTFLSLCTSVHSIEVLWSQIVQKVTENQGRFVFLRAVAATFANAPEFYLERIEEITEILEVSIMSNSQLLRDAAARTADELINFYVFESDELSIKLAPIVVSACHEHVSADLLLVCARLLNTTKKTDQYFDNTFPFLLNCIQSSAIDVQDASLQCVSALAKWSTININRDFRILLPMLHDLLRSGFDHLMYLKAPAVDLVAKLSGAVGELLDQFLIEDALPFMVENIEGEDVALSISCLIAIKDIIIYTSKRVIVDFVQPLVQKLMKFAEIDYSQQYVDSLNNIDPLSLTVFLIPGYSLQILGTLYYHFNQNLEEILPFIIHCCEIHKNSRSEFCQSSFAIAISDIVKIESTEKICPNLALMLIPLLSVNLSMDVNYDIIGALTAMLSYHDYTIFTPAMRNMILGIINQFLTDPKTLSYRPKERQRDIYEGILEFLQKFIISSGSNAPTLLGEINQCFIDFVQSPSQRLQSYAIRYLGELVNFSSETLNLDVQVSTVNFAIQMIQKDNDFAPYFALQKIAFNNPQLVKPFAEGLYPIFIEKLKMPFIKTEKLLMFRDNCVTTFCLFASNFYHDVIDLAECAPIVLSALPLAIDFEERKQRYVVRFFMTLYENVKTQFPDKFLRVLTVIFSNPRCVIDEMNFIKNDLNSLYKILLELVELQNAAELCSTFLGNDQSKMNFLKDNIENGL